MHRQLGICGSLQITSHRAIARLALVALFAFMPFAASAMTRIELTGTGLGRLGDQMGSAVALAGDTALVGAPGTYVSPIYPQGTAMIYRNGAGGWHLEAQLTPEEATPNMAFGAATALGPDLAVVGGNSSLTTFERSGTTWTEVDSMEATGWQQIGLSGDTLVAAGVVYVRNGSAWQVQAELQPLAGDTYFLDNMAIDGDIVVAAASAFGDFYQPRALYFFSRSGGTWTNEGFVELGTSTIPLPLNVAVSGNTALVNTVALNGTSTVSVVRVFERDAVGVWNDRGVLDAGTDLSGLLSVSIEGDVAIVGSRTNMGAYTFARSGGTWMRTVHVVDPDSTFCFSAVALSGSNLLTGCPDTVAPSGGWGTSQIFSLDADPPPVVAAFDQGDAQVDEQLGIGVALSGSTLVAQSYLGTSVFAQQGGTWAVQTTIPSPVDFGPSFALAIDEGTLAVGYSPGAVGVYVDSAQGWTLQAFLQGGTTFPSPFGVTVALHGEMLAVGDPDSAFTAGACDIYQRTGTSWNETQTLTATDGAAFDGFCSAVAMDQDTLIAGAPNWDMGIEHDAGAAYVFIRSGQGWTQRARLVAPLVADGAHFGSSVAVSGDVAVVGAINGFVETSTRGAAYVYRRNGSIWSLEATLQDLVVGDVPGNFGSRVGASASGDKVFVAAPNGYPASPGNGIVYVFAFDGMQWTFAPSLVGSPPFPAIGGDRFGISMAIDGDAFAIGATKDGASGAVYVGSVSETVFANGFDPSP